MSKIIRRHVEITRRTVETKIIKIENLDSELIFCTLCGAKVLGVSFDNAQLIFGVFEDSLQSFAKQNAIHLFGDERLCLDSLRKFFEKEIRVVED